MLVWNPLLTSFLCLFFVGSHHFLRSWFVFLYVSDLVCGVCFASLFLAVVLDHALARRKGRPAPTRPIIWYWMLSFTVMPFGLFFAFAVAGVTLPRLGIPWDP